MSQHALPCSPPLPSSSPKTIESDLIVFAGCLATTIVNLCPSFTGIKEMLRTCEILCRRT